MTPSAPPPLINPRDEIGFRLVALARRWRQVLDRELAHRQLTDATWAPLFHLHQGGDNISQTELAERLGLETSSLVRLVDLLEQRGLIERRVDAKDRRARRVLLTETGRQEFAVLRAKTLEIEHALLCDLDESEVALLRELINRIDARVSRKAHDAGA